MEQLLAPRRYLHYVNARVDSGKDLSLSQEREENVIRFSYNRFSQVKNITLMLDVRDISFNIEFCIRSMINLYGARFQE